MNKRILYFYILFVFFATGSYLFYKGEIMGIERYKNSKNFQLTLEAAYRYGHWDCQEGR